MVVLSAYAKAQSTDNAAVIEQLKQANEELNHRLDVLQKMVDDVLWFDRLSDVAFVDKVYMYGPPPAVVKNPTAMGANNPVKF